MEYCRPDSLDEALLKLSSGRYDILAGGTDFYPALGDAPCKRNVLDISAIDGLAGISPVDGAFRIGALTTWADVAAADLPPQFDALKGAAREIGSVQIQNVGTVAGNICNASPAADGMPPLLALDADVEIARADGKRVLPLADFVLDNRKTALAPGEMVTAVLVPEMGGGAVGRFMKLGARRYLVISIAMVAAVIRMDDSGAVAEARVSVGACSAVAKRLGALEADLIGVPRSRLSSVVEKKHLANLAPISDVRATADYRLVAAEELLRRALDSCGEAV